MIRVEFPYAAGCGRAFAMRCHVISSLTNTVFFRWGTVTLTFPPYRFYCRPSRPPKLCSRLHKCTMFRKVCQVADYINVPCFGKSVNWTCSEPVRSMHCLHDQKSLQETCLSGFARERGRIHNGDQHDEY